MVFIKNNKLNNFSKELRLNMTKEEKHLWYDYLRNHKLTFNRQFVIGNYIADFYCHSKKLIIELDGGQHYEDNSLLYDENRTNYFNSLGIRVIRFTNTDINKRFDCVCEEIEHVLNGIK